MTDEEWKDLIASFAVERKETERLFREADMRSNEAERNLKEKFAETDRQIKETDQQIKETDRQMKETDRQMKETDLKIAKMFENIDGMLKRQSENINSIYKKTSEQIESVSKQMGGINENIGHHAEQFFQNVFADNRTFGGTKYDDIILNMKHSEDVEFDIFLRNGNSVAIIEVKNRIHPGFVKDLAEERMSKFRRYFPEYKDYDAYLGIAGFSFSEEVLLEAKKYGVGIIKQVGKGIEVDSAGLKAYR